MSDMMEEERRYPGNQTFSEFFKDGRVCVDNNHNMV